MCDAMLGGLARWLRAAGYSAEFDSGARDGALVKEAFDRGKVLLTSDAGIMERYAVDRELVSTLFVPLGLSPVEQLGHVLGELDLPLRTSRCMDCNGVLREVRLEDVSSEVPWRVQECHSQFFRCAGCQKIFWHGDHWKSISSRLSKAVELGAIGR